MSIHPTSRQGDEQPPKYREMDTLRKKIVGEYRTETNEIYGAESGIAQPESVNRAEGQTIQRHCNQSANDCRESPTGCKASLLS